MADAPGIHSLPDAELLRLAKAIAREDFKSPVSRAALVLAKFGHLEGQLDALVGHDKRAALAIIGAILRERQRAPASRAGIAWSGPSPTGHGTRAPYDLLVELIATAEHDVWFTGVDLVREARLLRSLHAAQRGRELRAVVILASGAVRDLQLADELFGTFKPWPELYAPDPNRLRGALPLSLLSDRTRGVVLAGAAPDVESPDHDLTAGILLEDALHIGALYTQWQTLIDIGAIVPLTAASEADVPQS
ncbi:MAG: hypothetical protein ABW321_05495 [Polyangiales bacterium]